MSVDTLASQNSFASDDAIAITTVESYLRFCQVVDSNSMREVAEQIVQQASDACRSFASADARQLCKLSLRLASQRMTETLMHSAARVIPRETPTRMSPAAPVRLAAPLRFSYWRDALRPARAATLTAKT